MKSFFRTDGGAPVLIVAYAGKSASGQWDTHSTAVALENLLLVAYAEGLGGVCTDGILVKEPEINATLGIEGRKLVAVVPLGYPDETPRKPPSPERESAMGWFWMRANPSICLSHRPHHQAQDYLLHQRHEIYQPKQ